MKISITPGSTLPAQADFANWRAWGPTLLLALILAASIVTFLDKWLWSNEVFNSLPMGFSYESGEQGLTRLRNEALHYCDQFAAPDDLKACRIYQDSVTDRLYFAHPLAALLGLQVRGLLGEPDWLPRLHWIAIELPLVSGVLALVIWSVLTKALPGPERGMAVAVTLCLLLISYGHDRNFAPLPDAVRDAGTWLAPTTLLLVAIAAFVLARRRAVIWPSLVASPDATRTLFRAALVLVILSVALPPAFNAVLAPVAMVALLVGALPGAASAILGCAITGVKGCGRANGSASAEGRAGMIPSQSAGSACSAISPLGVLTSVATICSSARTDSIPLRSAASVCWRSTCAWP